MKVIEDRNDVQVILSSSEDGLAEYTVTFRGDEKLTTKHREKAVAFFEQLQPRRVQCGRCKEVDLVSFPAELGIGHIRVSGDGGWLMERIFGHIEHDVVLCPDCVEKGVPQ